MRTKIFPLLQLSTLNQLASQLFTPTQDRDFTYNWTTLRNHPGVILISSGKQTPDSINKICAKGFQKLTPRFVSGSLVRITSDKILRNKNNIIEKVDV